MMMWKNPQELDDVKRDVGKLIESWLRPVFKKTSVLSGASRSHLPTSDVNRAAREVTKRYTLDDEDPEMAEESKKYMHAMRPKEMAMEFTRRPESQVVVEKGDKKKSADVHRLTQLIAKGKSKAGGDKYRMVTMSHSK